MDERIKIYTRGVKDGFRSRVMVNGEWYASVDAPTREEAQGEAQHYAMQIEFDEKIDGAEGGTGDRTRLGTYL